jgi:AcrR family transcriptional regulator
MTRTPTAPTPPDPAGSGTSGAPRATQARAVATRDAIVVGAAAEFADAGYHAGSLARIVERTRVTKRALYFHFSSKEALAHAVVEEMATLCHQLVDQARAAPTDPLRQAARLAGRVQDLLAGPPTMRAGHRLCAEGAAGPGRAGWPWTFWQEVFGEFVARAHADGIVHDDVDHAGMGRFVTDLSSGAFTASLGTTGLVDLAERVRHNWEVMFRAVATDRWLVGWRAEGGMAAVLAAHLRAVPGGG